MVAEASAQQNAVDARDLVRTIEQPGFLAYRHQRADVIEQIDKQEHEDDLEEAEPQRRSDIQLASGRARVGQAVACGCQSTRPAAQPDSVVASMPISMAAAHAPRQQGGDATAGRRGPARCWDRADCPGSRSSRRLGTMMPELRKPMSAMNRPTPAATAA